MHFVEEMVRYNAMEQWKGSQEDKNTNHDSNSDTDAETRKEEHLHEEILVQNTPKGTIAHCFNFHWASISVSMVRTYFFIYWNLKMLLHEKKHNIVYVTHRSTFNSSSNINDIALLLM